MPSAAVGPSLPPGSQGLLSAPNERQLLPDGTLEISRRVPAMVRVFGWVVEILSLLFALLAIIFGTPGDAPLVLVLLASFALAGLGEFCRSGASELRVEPGRRRLVGRMRTRFGTIPLSEQSLPLSAETRLAVTRKRANGHDFYYLVGRRAGSGRSVPLFSHTQRDGAEEVLAWVQAFLREREIPGQD